MPFCRAPMPWPDLSGAANGGDPAAHEPSVWDTALFSDLQRLIAFRKASLALQRGSMRFLLAQDEAIGFMREYGGERVVVLASRKSGEQESGEQPTRFELPAGTWQDPLGTHTLEGGPTELHLQGGRILVSCD